MNLKKKVLTMALGGLVIAGIVAAATLTHPLVSSAQTEEPSAGQAAPASGLAERMGPRGHDNAYLAEALGITEDELAAAQTKAREAAIAQAVKDGVITQEQADALLSGSRAGLKGVRLNPRGLNLDEEAYLAEALGISVEKLQAAEATAAKAALDQAVADGRLTQEEADLMDARQALQQYIIDKGLFKSAVDAAVADGVITQAQADAILSETQDGGRLEFGFGFDLGGPEGGRGGHGGRGHGDFGRGDPGTGDATPQGTES